MLQPQFVPHPLRRMASTPVGPDRVPRDGAAAIAVARPRVQTGTMRPDHVAPTRFSDRAEAGEYLAAELEHHAADENVVVLGLLSGGVPVAAAIAKHLGVEVDALAVSGLVLPERSTSPMRRWRPTGTTCP